MEAMFLLMMNWNPKTADELQSAWGRGTGPVNGPRLQKRLAVPLGMKMLETELLIWQEETRSLGRGWKEELSRKEFEDDAEDSFSDPDSDVSDEDSGAEQARLLRKLNRISNAGAEDDSTPGSKLANMKFMLKADAARKKENDAMVEEMRRELAGEEPPSEEEEEVDIGRQDIWAYQKQRAREDNYKAPERL